ETSAVGVARLYQALAATLVIDNEDAPAAGNVERLGIHARVTGAVMTDAPTRRSLAAAALAAAGLGP
ncbi:MAG: 2-phospho-L-lactate transferase, partial [Gaiellales bacterium]